MARAAAVSEPEFVRLTAPHRRALHVHCYRMLGSLDDADDALQETLLRAWRSIERFEPRATLSTWLHRIATNVCLRMLEQRSRRAEREVGEDLHPYPDAMLDPAGEAELRESVGLAFVAALQFLPPRQRVVLLLRDVLGWSAAETAETLGDSVPAVNSALQRARERLRRERAEGRLAREHAPASEGRLMARFQEAWQAVDIPALVELMATDAVLTMPPEGARFDGAAAIGAFFGSVPLEGRLDRIALVETRANGQPALAAYADGQPYGVMVFACEGDRITGITGFPDPALFPRLGMPEALA